MKEPVVLLSIDILVDKAWNMHMTAWNILSKAIQRRPVRSDELSDATNTLENKHVVDQFMGGCECCDELDYWAAKKEQLFFHILERNEVSLIRPQDILDCDFSIICATNGEGQAWYPAHLGLDASRFVFPSDLEMKMSDFFTEAYEKVHPDILLMARPTHIETARKAGFSRIAIIHPDYKDKTVPTYASLQDFAKGVTV